MQLKNLDAVRLFFSEETDLDRIIEEELIGTSMLHFLEGYTRFSCSGHIYAIGSGNCLVTSPRLEFMYADISSSALNFHRKLNSIEIKHEGNMFMFRISPEKMKDKMKLIVDGGIPDIIEIKSNKGYEYKLYSKASKIIGDAYSVRVLEEFWDKYSLVLSEFLEPNIYQQRKFTHDIKDGKLFTPFSKPPNEGINLVRSESGKYVEFEISLNPD